jgi:hypothetical protein
MLSDRASAFARPLMGSKHSIQWARICRKKAILAGRISHLHRVVSLI